MAYIKDIPTLKGDNYIEWKKRSTRLHIGCGGLGSHHTVSERTCGTGEGD